MEERWFEVSKVHFLEKDLLLSSIRIGHEHDDPILDQVLQGKFDENFSLAFWSFMAAAAAPGELFVDVGAFSGIYSLLAVKTNSQIKVVAFEPSTVTFGRLAQNIRINGLDIQIIPLNVAASDKVGFSSFPHQYGIYNLCPGECLSQQQIDHTQTVATIPIDKILEPVDSLPDYLNSKGVPFYPFTNIAAIKIDVERHELFVLKGGKSIITRYRPVFICEVLGDKEKFNLLDFFSHFNYETFEVPNERNMFFIPSEKYTSLIDSFKASDFCRRGKMMGSVTMSFLVY